MSTTNDRRMDRIRHLLGFRIDPELAQYLKTNQPQISRWRNAGFAKSIANLIDSLLSIISIQRKEIIELKKELKSLKRSKE